MPQQRQPLASHCVLAAGIPLDYEVIPFGIHRTTINRLASILTTALTTDDQQKSQVHDRYI